MAWSKESRHKRGYDNEWYKTRARILRRDKGLCRCDECKSSLCPEVATEVHHITSKAAAKQLGWDREQTDHPDNLISINKECHKRETQKEQGKALKVRVSIGDDGWPV